MAVRDAIGKVLGSGASAAQGAALERLAAALAGRTSDAARRDLCSAN